MRWNTLPVFLVAGLVCHSTIGQANDSGNNSEKIELAVPVYEGDIGQSYSIIGKIDDNLRKHFAFQANPTKAKIYAEIWERGRKMGADAVIHAKYGETRRTLFNNGRTPISGTAIRYTDVGKKR
jgi:hypothetical protein